jgi:hypothetical protein
MTHDERSIKIAVGIAAAMMLVALGFITWGLVGMVALWL